jgi:Domain of unknown function (DUF4070)
MMRDANFGAVFIGIESPNADTLLSMQKKQNTRRDLAKSIQSIYRAGMFVTAGFIVGFDSEKAGMAEEMIAYVEATSIPVCMIGLLTALPNTQLSRRLISEERAGPQDFRFVPDTQAAGDQCVLGLNFETLRPRREILSDYKLILETIYEPAAFFARVRIMGKLLRRPKFRSRVSLAGALDDVRTLGRLAGWLLGRNPEFIGPTLMTIFDCALKNPAALHQVVSEVLMYLHVGPFARGLVIEIDKQLAMLEAEPDRLRIASAARAHAGQSTKMGDQAVASLH